MQSAELLEPIRRYDKDGNEYWSARELMEALDIDPAEILDTNPCSWIRNAIAECGNMGGFTTRFEFRRKDDDWQLSYIACHFIFKRCYEGQHPNLKIVKNYFNCDRDLRKVDRKEEIAPPRPVVEKEDSSPLPSVLCPQPSQGISPFDAIRRYDKDGNEYWSARELMQILGYQAWDNFAVSKKGRSSVIKKAQTACINTGKNQENHFLQVETVVYRPQGGGTKQGDWHLTRYACYLIAMNGDPTKPEIAMAQSYFAIATHENELRNQQEETETESKSKTTSEAIAFATQCLIEAGVEQKTVKQYQLRQLAKLEPQNAQVYDMACRSLAEAHVTDNKPVLVTKVGEMICNRLNLDRNLKSFAITINQKLAEIGFQEKDIKYINGKPENKGWVLTTAGKPWAIVENPTDPEGRSRPQIKWLPQIVDVLLEKADLTISTLMLR